MGFSNMLPVNTSGLQLVKSQTVGTGVTSVPVTGAFSSDFQNYRVIFEGGTGSAAASNLTMQLSGITGATAYRQLGFYQAWGSSTLTPYAADSSSFIVAQSTTSGYSWIVDITNPNETLVKFVTVSGLGTSSQYFFPTFINSTTAASGFTLTVGTGTITGGTIRVYGYRK